MKNTLLALLGFILLSAPLAATAQQFGDFTYAPYGTGVAITGYTGPGGAVTIPDTINGLLVTAILQFAFENNANLTTITVPGGVHLIGKYAFASCTSLNAIAVNATNFFYSSLDGVLFNKSLTALIQYPAGKAGSYVVPGSVSSIGLGAFSSSPNLTSVAIPGSVTSIGDGAFAGSTNLASVTIPAGIANIGTDMFWHCASLPSVTIPGSVTNIGDYAFAGCASLTNIAIPGSVSSIGNQAFENCASLEAITVDGASAYYSSLDGVLFDKSQATLIQYPGGKPGSYVIPGAVTNIGIAFAYCPSLTSVTIPGSVASFGGSTFFNCTGLRSVTILSGVNVIGNGVFESCSNLTSVTMPGSITNIGAQAFEYCTSLTNITIPGGVPIIDDYTFEGCSSLTNLTILNGVYIIGNWAFQNCTSLTTVTIPGSVSVIGNQAFQNCTSLTRLTFLNVTVIQAGAFENCTSLTSVAFPSSLTSIGMVAFLQCTSLTNIIIPDNVIIGAGAFQLCTALKGVFIKGNAPSVPSVFLGDTNATVYYLPGTTGWGATFDALPAVLWNPLMQSSGVGPGGFGFNITGTTNIPIVIEAATNLANAAWVPLQSLNLTNGAFYFNDPNWTNYPSRFYRIRSP